MTPEAFTLALGGRWYGSYGTACCPAHDDRRHSLSIAAGQRVDMVLKCHAGCPQAAVLQAARELHGRDGALCGPPGSTRDAKPADEAVAERKAAALGMWRACRGAHGTPAHSYLASRGIRLDPPPSLRWSAALKHAPTGLFLSGLVAGVQGPDGSLCAVHRTYLTAEGRKAPVSAAKMALGPLGNGAVRLAKAGPMLGLAEGVETGLSAMQVHGVPVWCALGAPRLATIDLPTHVRQVVLFADNGRPGLEAAANAARRYRGEGREVAIRPPAPEFQDWNDVAQACAREATK